MTTPADVVKRIRDESVKFVDLRFTDTRGKEQHSTVPARVVDERFFETGKMFDGSSIAGWRSTTSRTWCSAPSPRAPSSIPSATSRPSFFAATCWSPTPWRAMTAIRAPSPSARKPISRRPASPTPRSSGPSPSSSSSTTCASATGSIIASTRSGPRKERGTPSGTETADTGSGSRAATSRCRRSIRCSMCARRCASPSRRSGSRSRCTTTRWEPADRRRSAPGRPPWSRRRTRSRRSST